MFKKLINSANFVIMTLYMAKGFNKGPFIGGGGGRGERMGGKVPEGETDWLKLGFTCNLCGHHRTVMIHKPTGMTGDYESGTHPEKGDPAVKYIIKIMPDATQGDVAEAVAEAHRLTCHPFSEVAHVVDVRS